MSKSKPDEFSNANSTGDPLPTEFKKAETPYEQKIEEPFINLETYASARELTFQAKSRLQYLVDSRQAKKEMTMAKWDEVLKGC